jgi:hypothetical protein
MMTSGNGVGVLVAVGSGVGVTVEVAVGLGVDVAVAVGVGVADGVGVDSGTEVGVLVGVGVAVGRAPHPLRDALASASALKAITNSAAMRMGRTTGGRCRFMCPCLSPGMDGGSVLPVRTKAKNT